MSNTCVSVSDRGEALLALQREIEEVERQQLEVSEEICRATSGLLLQAKKLSERSASLHRMMSKVMEYKDPSLLYEKLNHPGN